MTERSDTNGGLIPEGNWVGTVKGQEFDTQSFRGHYLNYALYVDCSFKNCDLSEIDGRLVQFMSCSFENCEFDNANLVNALFDGCVFMFSSNPNSVSVIDNASFSGARFRRCQFSSDAIIVIKNTSFREAEMSDCRFDALDLRDTSIEDASIVRSSFSALDISYSSVSGLSLIDTNFESIVFSVPTFFLTIGSWSILQASNVVMIVMEGGSIQRRITSKSEIKHELTHHLSEEIEKNRSLWRISNGLISLNYPELLSPDLSEKLFARISSAFLVSELSEEQIIDEFSTLLRALDVLDLHSERILDVANRLLTSYAPLSEDMHPSVWSSFLIAFEDYAQRVRPSVVLTFSFGGLDVFEPSSIQIANAFITRLEEFVGEPLTRKDLTIRSGSVSVEFIEALSTIPLWLAAFAALGMSARVNVNFDINRFIDQIAGSAKALRAKTTKQMSSRLLAEMDENDVLIVVSEERKRLKNEKHVLISENQLVQLAKRLDRDKT